MRPDVDEDRASFLSLKERGAAAVVGVLMLAIAALVLLYPPARTVVISGCTPNESSDCTAEVDGDFSLSTSILLGLAGVALIVALIGLRLDKLKLGGAELSRSEYAQRFDNLVEGLPTDRLLPEPDDEDSAEGRETPESKLHGTTPDVAARVQPPQLSLSKLEPDMREDLRQQIYGAHHNIFVVHVLDPPTLKHQKYRVALFLKHHRQRENSNDADFGETDLTKKDVKSATFYCGRNWAFKTFEARWSGDKLGVVIEAFGEFLVLCEVHLPDGSRILLSHYVDFSMGGLLANG